jgi:high-affinity iron transporter
VLREGVETVVFLLAAFNESTSGASSAIGACLGIAVAVALGYGIYRGGVRINLSKFFRATGLVLVLVAAGILVNALHTAHEAGWLNAGQQNTIDLTWLVQPGSVQASLLTGMLGLQPRPVVIEVVGWLVYLVPVGLYVAWPAGRGFSRRTLARTALGAALALAAAAAVLAVAAPARPAAQPTTDGASVVSTGSSAVIRIDASTRTLVRTGTAERDGLAVTVYSATVPASPGPDLPATLGYGRIADLNGGRLPIGLRPTGTGAAATYVARATTTAWIEPRTARIVDLRTSDRVTVSVAGFALSSPIRSTGSAWAATTVRSSAAAGRAALDDLNRRSAFLTLAWTAGLLALALAVGAALARPRRRETEPLEIDHLVRLGSPN